MNKMTIGVITGSRADYGLLRWVIKGIKESKELKLHLYVTGMHLSSIHGDSLNEIHNDGILSYTKIETQLSSDTAASVSKSIGLGVIGFADSFSQSRPDLLVILGDRYEVMPAAISALPFQIPIAHLHGGERTEGLIDEGIRHSITKLSHLHFVSTEEYRNRVIQLGECPNRVENVGALGIDNINKLSLLKKEEIENKINFKFGKKNLLVTYHPVTLCFTDQEHEICEILDALETFKDITIIFTMTNADPYSHGIWLKIKQFKKFNPNSLIIENMGSLVYLSILQVVDGVLGNSSSGIIEAPSLQTWTIDVGDRQKGRVKAESVIKCSGKKKDVVKAINQIFSDGSKTMIKKFKNPYGSGGASSKIVQKLKLVTPESLIQKKFYTTINS